MDPDCSYRPIFAPILRAKREKHNFVHYFALTLLSLNTLGVGYYGTEDYGTVGP